MSERSDGRVYRVVHRTEYRYDAEVTASYGRAFLTPRQDTGQRRISHRLEIDPPPADLREHTDFFGNRTTYFNVTTGHARLAVTADSVVAVDRAPPEQVALDTVGWETVRDALADRADLQPDLIAARPFVLPSPLLPADPAVTAFANKLIRPGQGLGAAVRALLAEIGAGFDYVTGSTTLHTPPGVVLEQRTGVCQDFAHLTVACLRAVGLAARYVSGYLETVPPPGQERLLGADASHAWASVFSPSAGWVDLDPTNAKLVDSDYVVTAIGRDYADVPPLRGVIYTESAASTMTVSVDVARVRPGLDDPV